MHIYCHYICLNKQNCNNFENTRLNQYYSMWVPASFVHSSQFHTNIHTWIHLIKEWPGAVMGQWAVFLRGARGPGGKMEQCKERKQVTEGAEQRSLEREIRKKQTIVRKMLFTFVFFFSSLQRNVKLIFGCFLRVKNK